MDTDMGYGYERHGDEDTANFWRTKTWVQHENECVYPWFYVCVFIYMDTHVI